MTYYIESRQTDPAYNLALEQAVFDSADPSDAYFMLWQNHNAIIIGRHQNTLEEINSAFVTEHGISVVRRLSGGGAVYHDLGNLNFTFITPAGTADKIDFSFFCRPVQKALLPLGVPVEISGRNDMTVEGKKFSGNAQYIKNNRIMHHGTILFDSDLQMLSGALKAKDKVESKAVKSVPGKVTNIKPYMEKIIDFQKFRDIFMKNMIAEFQMQELSLTSGHLEMAADLREKVYSQWDWNYGRSPPYTLRKTRRVEGCGKIDIFLDIGREGLIAGAAIYGDFFSRNEPKVLCDILTGHHLEYNELMAALAGTDISQYINALEANTFIKLLLE
ncbi:MAG: lipoate--protein ligase [Treponema sp.]|nr:lipoate--protein ligase [Treponema sp.]